MILFHGPVPQEEEAKMNVAILTKCLYYDRFTIYKKIFGSDESFKGWRCIYCNEIFVDIVFENRTIQVEVHQK